MRGALTDAAPQYRDSTEAQDTRASAQRVIDAFMEEALSNASPPSRALAGDLIMTALSQVGKQFSSRPRATDEMISAMADMFCAYIKSLNAP